MLRLIFVSGSQRERQVNQSHTHLCQLLVQARLLSLWDRHGHTCGMGTGLSSFPPGGPEDYMR